MICLSVCLSQCLLLLNRRRPSTRWCRTTTSCCVVERLGFPSRPFTGRRTEFRSLTVTSDTGCCAPAGSPSPSYGIHTLSFHLQSWNIKGVCIAIEKATLVKFNTYTRYSAAERFLLFSIDSYHPYIVVWTITVFTRKSSYSACPSVCQTGGSVKNDSLQARITKSTPSAARKTVVSGTVKLFHKFEESHPERGR